MLAVWALGRSPCLHNGKLNLQQLHLQQQSYGWSTIQLQRCQTLGQWRARDPCCCRWLHDTCLVCVVCISKLPTKEPINLTHKLHPTTAAQGPGQLANCTMMCLASGPVAIILDMWHLQRHRNMWMVDSAIVQSQRSKKWRASPKQDGLRYWNSACFFFICGVLPYQFLLTYEAIFLSWSSESSKWCSMSFLCLSLSTYIKYVIEVYT